MARAGACAGRPRPSAAHPAPHLGGVSEAFSVSSEAPTGLGSCVTQVQQSCLGSPFAGPPILLLPPCAPRHTGPFPGAPRSHLRAGTGVSVPQSTGVTGLVAKRGVPVRPAVRGPRAASPRPKALPPCLRSCCSPRACSPVLAGLGAGRPLGHVPVWPRTWAGGHCPGSAPRPRHQASADKGRDTRRLRWPAGCCCWRPT